MNVLFIDRWSGIKRIVDRRGFYTAMISVVAVMIIQGIVSPHINLKVLDVMGLLWVSLLTLGFMTARSFSSIIHAVLYKTLAPRYTGILGLILLELCYLLYIHLPVAYYPLVRILEGIASGLFWPLMQSLIVNSVAVDWRSRMLSIYFLVGNISGYMGYQAGSLIYLYLGSSNIVYSGLILLAFYTIVYAILSPRNGIGYRGGASTRRKFIYVIGEAGRIKRYIPLIVFLGGINGLMKDYLFAYTKLITGYSEPVLRNYWSIIGYTGLVLSILFSHLYEARGYGRRVIALSTIMLSSIILVPFTKNPYMLLIILSLVIVGSRTLRPIIRGIASRMTSRPEDAIALVNSISNISAGTTPFIIALMQSIMTV